MILVLLALFFVLVGLTCILIYNKTDNYNGEGWLGTGVCLVVITGICLLICIISISIKEVEANAWIARIEAVRGTFESARIDKDVHPLELAAIQQKVADKNEWIANAQYWASCPLTNWFWSKKISAIKPIR